MKDLPRAAKKRPQRLTEGEKKQPSTDAFIADLLGNVISVYVEMERRLPKEKATAFHDAICVIEQILREAHQDNAQGIHAQEEK